MIFIWSRLLSVFHKFHVCMEKILNHLNKIVGNCITHEIMDNDKKRFIERGSHKGKGLAVFTSGGDSQGILFNFFILLNCM